MSSLYSTYWYRVTDLEPRLRSHVNVTRHFYRHQPWYILRDSHTGRHQRFNMAAYYIIGLMDGRKTVDEIWQASLDFLGDEAPSQDEVIALLGQLHRTDLLQCNVTPDTLELFDRQQHAESQSTFSTFSNPFALRLPLINPDHFLQKWAFLIRPLLHWPALILWMCTVATALLLAFSHWPELSHNITDRVLTPQNIIILWLLYPLIKLLHELGHAFAIKIWGGEVHEMGIMLLAFTPIPYVEASASAAFAAKSRRIIVAAVGMAVELFIAALALFIWLAVEPGMVKAIAYNIMLIGGASTLLFNGNPLLRFDGYYILADAIEIPNLAQRSNKYLGFLAQYYLFGMSELKSPVTAPGEEFWLITYGLCSFAYRMLVVFGLLLFIGSKFFIVGIMLAIWGAFSQLLKPAAMAAHRLYKAARQQRQTTRFALMSLLLLVLFTTAFFIVPAPFRTRSEGVVWIPEQSQLRAGSDGVIVSILAPVGSKVKKGQPLIVCEDPFLVTETTVIAANLQEAQARYNAEPLQATVQRAILKEEIQTIQADLHQHRQRLKSLILNSSANGIFIVPENRELLGRFIKKGQRLGYVVGKENPAIIRLVVNHKDISLIRDAVISVKIRAAEQFNHITTTTIANIVPAGGNKLPTAALGVQGGGQIPVDPRDPQGCVTLQKIFQMDVILPPELQGLKIGGRVFIRFDHPKTPLANQCYRALRQLFLRQFNV